MMTRSPIGKPRRHAGDELLVLVRLLDGCEARVRELAHRDEPRANAIFGNGKNRLLGFVENLVRLELGFVGGRDDLVCGEDEIAQRRVRIVPVPVGVTVLDEDRSRADQTEISVPDLRGHV